MRVLFLIILFYTCGIKTTFSQGIFMGSFNYSCTDTINHIIHDFWHAPTFDNFPNNSLVFPETIHCNEKAYPIQDIHLFEYENLKDKYLPSELPDSLVNILFELDIINRWPDMFMSHRYVIYEPHDTIASNRRLTVFTPPAVDVDLINDDDIIEPPLYTDRDDYLKKIRNSSKMYLLGNIAINENFTSKLIYVCLKDDVPALYLVNIKNNRLRSVVHIDPDYCDSSICFLLDFELSDQVFSLKYKTIRKGKGVYNEINHFPSFYYDDEGYLHLMPHYTIDL